MDSGKKKQLGLVRLVNCLDAVLVNVCALVLGAMVLISLVAIFFRYVLGNALSWTEELTRYLMIFVGMFGTALALWKDEHVGFTTIVERLPRRAQKIAGIASYLLVGSLAGVIVFEGFRWTLASGATAQILPIPMWMPMCVIPLGGVLLLVVVLAKIACVVWGEDE